MKKFLTLFIAVSLSAPIFSQSEIVKSNNEFAFELFSSINKADTTTANSFVSPFSVYDALAMAYDGAAKKTAKEMRKVLKFKKNQNESHKEFTQLLETYKSDKNFLTITNAAVAQKDYNFLETYLADLKDYNAILSSADFSNDAAKSEAIKKINEWVEKNTNGKIKNLLHKNDVNSLTKLVLLNAIYFNASWAKEFKTEKTRPMTFYGKNSLEYVTDFMNGTQTVELNDNEEATMMKLEYADKKASMYIIMPKKDTDIDEYISQMTYEKFESLMNDTKLIKADVSMPKFKIESRYEMKDVLYGMGIKSAFLNSANFSKMNGRTNLMIDNVIHQSLVEVSEKGTEAAAATAVIVREKTATNAHNPKLSINRPFVFVIKEQKNDAVLFIGKYVKPEKNTK